MTRRGDDASAAECRAPRAARSAPMFAAATRYVL